MFIYLSKVFFPTYVNLLLHYKPRCMNEQNNEIGDQLVVVITTIVQEITQILLVEISQNSQNFLIKKLTRENNNNLEGNDGNRTLVSSIT